jgi:cobalamin biosynthesis Mg chelatase CobN
MAFFPSLVQARESSGIQYESEVPTVPSHESIPPAKHHGSNTQSEGESEASGSNAPGGGGTGNGGSNKGGGAHSGQSKQGSPGGSGGTGTGTKSAKGGKVAQSQPIVNASHPVEGSSEGSSSPLVPILIAIAVLAAISVGAFYFRQRRQGEGPDSSDSPVSPKAS